MKFIIIGLILFFSINAYSTNHEGTVCDFYRGARTDESAKFYTYNQGAWTVGIRLWHTHLENLFFILGEQSYDGYYVIEYGDFSDKYYDHAKTKMIDGNFDLIAYFSQINTTVHCYRD